MALGHSVVELRQYTLHPGQRDVLIGLFDRHFVESQEVHGMSIVGEFRDLENADRFVWLRSFADMETRASALQAFYTGPVWKAHRNAANATMIDSDNVLLLRPVRPDTGFAVDAHLPAPHPTGVQPGLVIACIVYLRPEPPGRFDDFFEKEVKSRWEAAGTTVVAQLVTNDSRNNFPPLPVREGENVFIWFSTFADAVAHERHRERLAADPKWRVVRGQLSLWTFQPIAILRLQPTARSRLHG